MVSWSDYSYIFSRTVFYKLIDEGYEFAEKHDRSKSGLVILKEYVAEPYYRGYSKPFSSVTEAENSIRKIGIRKFLDGYVNEDKEDKVTEDKKVTE